MRLRLPSPVRVVVIVSAIALSLTARAGATTLLGLVDTGELFASDDNGVTWTIRSTLPVRDAVDIYAGETSSELFLGAVSGSVYRSSDSGMNWTAVGAIPASDVAAMLVRLTGEVLVLTESGSLFESVDDGATFNAIAALTASDHASITEDRDSGTLYALTRTGGVAQSVDDGVSWMTVGVVTTSNAIEIRATNTTLYIMTETGDLARSQDDGATWTFISTTSQSGTRAMTVSFLSSSLFTSTVEGLIATTADGMSWSWPGHINQLKVTALGTDDPTVSSVDGDTPSFPESLTFAALRPNPLSGRGSVVFGFGLDAPASVGVDVYDVAGRLVSRIVATSFSAAPDHAIVWQPTGLGSGVYFVRLRTADGAAATRKMVIVR